MKGVLDAGIEELVKDDSKLTVKHVGKELQPC